LELVFEWNKKKAVANFNKHKVEFNEAKTVFFNPLSRIFDDEIHSINEKRELIIGHSDRGRLLIVIFTEKKQNLIRLISARIATNKERKEFEENIK